VSLVTLLIAVLLGGLGAGVAALLVRALAGAADAAKVKRRTQLAGGIAGGLAASLAPALAASTLGDWVAVELGIKSRGELVLSRALSPLTEDPRVKTALSGKDAVFAQAYTAGLVSRGVTLLPAADLERWARMRLRLAEASPAYCAGAWRGGLTPAEIHRAFDAVTEAEQQSFAELFTRAGKRALDAPPVERPSGRALQQGMLSIAESLPPAERAAFDEAVILADPGPERSCELFQLVLRRALGFAPAEREAFLRALATQLEQ
jgi:hypothetical protein